MAGSEQLSLQSQQLTSGERRRCSTCARSLSITLAT